MIKLEEADIVYDGVYVVQVNTSDKSDAGTDANVYIQISGVNYKTEKIPLTESKTHKNPFEKANRYVFTEQ